MEGPYEIRRLPSGSWSVSGPGRGSVWKEQLHALMAVDACNAAYAAELARLAPVVEAAEKAVAEYFEGDNYMGPPRSMIALRKSLAEWKEGGK